MALKKDRSDLPRQSGRKPPGRLPDQNPRFAPVLAKAWQDAYVEAGRANLPFSPTSAPWRHSWAATCARELQYRVREAAAVKAVFADPTSFLTGEAPEKIDPASDLSAVLTPEAIAAILEHRPTNPMGVADHWRFGIGSAVHELFQAAFARAFPEAEVEIRVEGKTGGAGQVDLVLRSERLTSIEIKTINGFGFKTMIGDRGTPEGPRWSSVVQCALNADALDADEAVLIVLSMENLSPAVLQRMLAGMAEPATEGEDQEWRRFCAEYSWTREEYAPIAAAENKRVNRVLELEADGKLVPRAIPDPDIPRGARITDPMRGIWTLIEPGTDVVLSTGSTWICSNYCGNRDRCIADGPS